MEFGAPPARRRGESIVPMINVVFLLLIFFLMTATIAPPDPFETAPPEAETAGTAEPADILFVGAGGELAFGDTRGAAVFAAVPAGAPLLVRADARLEADDLAGVLARLAGAGVTEVRLVAVAR